MSTREHPLKGKFDVDAANWVRTTSADGSPGSLEIGYAEDGLVALRKAEDPEDGLLIYTPDEWKAFVEGVRDGEFDLGTWSDEQVAGGVDNGSRLTERLRLEPVGPSNAADLWLVQGDGSAWPSYGSEKPLPEQVEQQAKHMGDSWRFHGVHKWIAYDRTSGGVVGRGGLSRTPVDDDWGQIYAFLPDEPWARATHEIGRPFLAHANWVEIGWALRHEFWGHGYAAEIGRTGLAFAFDVLGVQAAVSCTARHNARSLAVMERIGMRYAGEIRTRGMVEGVEEEQDDAPYAVCVLLRSAWD